VIAGLVACIVALAFYPGLILHRADLDTAETTGLVALHSCAPSEADFNGVVACTRRQLFGEAVADETLRQVYSGASTTSYGSVGK
jgi:hypothetical protein